MDALVFLFWVSWSASEIVGEPVTNDGIFNAVTAIIYYLMTYATGRQLIEPDLRFKTVRRFVILILALGPIGLYRVEVFAESLWHSRAKIPGHSAYLVLRARYTSEEWTRKDVGFPRS